jgi:hypothetical protein
MERVLQEVKLPALKKLSGACKRIAEGHKLSADPSAYWQAWKGVSEESILSVLQEVYEVIKGQDDSEQRLVVTVDGTSFDMPSTKALLEKYPPHVEKRPGKPWGSVFPQILVLNAHDLNTGCAITCEIGAKYGEKAENEINLMHKLLGRLPSGAVIVADRFHGIHSVVYTAQSRGQDCLLRMTEQRMKSLLKRARVKDQGIIDCRFNWIASERDKRKSGFEEERPVEVRLIAVDILRGKERLRLYLVTTLFEATVEEVVELYGRRWEMENDIRNIKQSTNVRELSSKSPALIRKEILAGLIAYNLVQAVILLAAQKYNKDHRRIKFLYALDAFNRYTLFIGRARSNTERQQLFDELLEMIADRVNKLRNRSSYPRQAYRRRNPYPLHQSQLI